MIAVRLLTANILMLLPLLAAAAPAKQALPLDLAYGSPQLWDEDIPIAVAANASSVAYVIRHMPADVDVAAGRWAKSGAPINASGTQVYISDAKSGQMRRACDNGGYTWRPAWSPDGSTLAFYSNAGGTVGLWVHELRSGECRKVGDAIIKAKIWVGDEAQWSPDSKTVYVPLIPEGRLPGHEAVREAEARAKTKSGDLTLYVSGGAAKPAATGTSDSSAPSEFLLEHLDRDSSAAVGAIDISSGAVKVLVPAGNEPRPSVMRVSASGKWLSFMSVMRPTSSAPNATTVTSLAVMRSDGSAARIVSDELLMSRRDYHRLNYVWHPTQDSLIYFKDGGLHRVDFDADGPRPAIQLGAELGELAPDVYTFTRDGRAVVARLAPGKSTNAGDRSAVLALIPFAGGASKRVSFDPNTWQYIDLIKADAQTVWQPGDHALRVRLRDVKSGEVAIVRVDPDTGGQRELWRGRARIQGLVAAADGGELFGSYEDISTPADVYRFSINMVRGKRLSRIAPGLDQVRAPRIELFTTRVPIHDHSIREVRTAVLLPADAKPGVPLPGVVTFYPDADSATEIDKFGGGNQAGVPALVLVSRGYAVVYPHVKLGPGGEPGNVIDEMLDAMLPQLYKAIDLGFIDPKRLALQGNSFGGFGTAAFVTRTNLFRAAVPTNGIYDLVGFTYAGADGNNVVWTESNQPRIGATLWDAPLRYIENSPLFSINKIQTPLLIMQGGDDRLRPEAEKLFAALKRLDKPAELAIYEKSGHWLAAWPRAQAIAATQRILDFYDRHLNDAN